MAEAGCEVNLFGRLWLLNFFLNHSFTQGDLHRFLGFTGRQGCVVSTSKAGTACANYRPMCRDNGVITAKMAQPRRAKAKDLTINHRVLVL
jgi:hypothetical protein